MASDLFSLDPPKTEFLLIGVPNQLSKTFNPVLHVASDTSVLPEPSVGNHGVIFDSYTSVSDYIPALCTSTFSHICVHRHIWSSLDHNTAVTIATSCIYSRPDYCNRSFLIFLPPSLIIFNLFSVPLFVTPPEHPKFSYLLWFEILSRAHNQQMLPI
jgi:hypothetical protein